MDNSSANIDLIRSHVDIIILKPLESHDRYGYEILKEIDTNSNGLFNLKQPTLYSCLKRLEKQGYINSYLGDESNGAQRRYYSLTQQGRDFLESQQAQWEFVRTVLSGLVSNVDFDKEKDVKPFDPAKYRPLTKRTRGDEDEEKVKVVEKIVYVPKEEELTSEEIKSKLTEEDIDGIVQDYLKTHDLKATSQEDDTQETIVDDIYSDSYNDDTPESDFTTFSEKNDAVEEDVSISEDDNAPFTPYQMSMKDIDESIYKDKTYLEEEVPPIVVESFSNQHDLDELVAPQSNNITSDEFIEEKPVSTKHIVKEEELIENNTYASYNNADDNDNSAFERHQTEKSDLFNYSVYQNNMNNLGKEDPKVEEKTVAQPVEEQSPIEDTQLFDYSRKINEPVTKDNPQDESINVFKALDSIYAVNDSDNETMEEDYVDPRYDDSHSQAYYNTTNKDYTHVETIGELKTKLSGEGFKVKPYTKINSSEFYINNYYYANRTARDTSLIMFAIFFIESMLAHFIMAPKFDLHFGYLALTWGVAALVPIFFTIKWAIAPYYKKHTRVSLKISLMVGLILMLNLALIIFLVGFFGFRVDYSDVNTMVLPIITPLVFLINIPLYSILYYILYKTKRYNLR